MTLKNKIIFIVLLFATLSISILPNLKADIDVIDLESANFLAQNNIINTQTNSKDYNINSYISRREMLKVMLNLAWISPSETCDNSFKDISSSDWACKYTKKALELSYISPNTYFRPDDNVSQAEALKMIFKAKNIEVLKTTLWETWYINKALELSYISWKINPSEKAQRKFVFNVSAKALKATDLIISKIDEKIESYQKPKVVINFSSSMNKSSVGSNLKLYPEVTYTSSWKDDKTLEVQIEQLITKETSLLVNVFDNALTSSWEKLQQTISKTFKIDWEPVIDFISPNWNISDLNQNITIRFSKPIISLTNLDNQITCPIEITPNITWECVWITTSTMQFRPNLWFPTWWKYSIHIPSWIKTISWDATINSKTFEIITPDFALISDINELQAQEHLKFAFNDEVLLSDFEKNFTLSNYLNDKLNFSYYKGEWELEENNHIIEVFPKTWDWWYEKNLNFNIKKTLTSSRWNLWLKSDISKTIKTQDFLVSYAPAIFLDQNSTQKYSLSNLKLSQNKEIITNSNASILLSFYKEIPLDKTLFESKLPFELNYVKYSNYENGKENLIEDKKQVLISFTWDIKTTFDVKIKLSKLSSSFDKNLTFKTKSLNSIIWYNQIDYKTSCLETKNPISTNNLNPYFSFDKYWKIDYTYDVNEWTKNLGCTFEKGKNKYLINMRLNPNSKYDLTIKNTLLDVDNYALDKDYKYNFTTPKAKNEDKSISFLDQRENILIPKSIKPLTLWVNSINLDNAKIEICVWDIDIISDNFLKDSKCISKNIVLNNLWFKPNITILDLEKIYWSIFSKNRVLVSISKNITDKSTYELTWQNDIRKTSFIISDISATIKSWENNILWLHNYSSWSSLTNEIQKIESYKKEPKYSSFWNYEWQKVAFEKNISFTSKENWIYELWTWNFNTLLITLKSWEQVILDDIYGNNSYWQDVYNYISTDKPIYKIWEKVNIFWISKILKPTWYLSNNWDIEVVVTDSKYKQVLSKKISLNDLWAYELNFELTKDLPLWNYNISIWQNYLSFAVEEYEKPDFKIDLTPKKDNYLFSQIPQVDVLWQYYINLPLSNWEWSYNLSSTEFYFDWWKTTWYTFWEERNFFMDYGISRWKMIWWYMGSSNIEQSSNFVLNNDWKTTLNIPITNDSKDKIYTLSATVTDPNTKKSISKNTTFKALRSNVFLWIKFDKYYYAFKDNAIISMVWVDISWNKLLNQEFNYKVYKVDYNYNENTYNYDLKETLVLNKNLKTSDSWLVNENFIFDKYWEYRFEISKWEYKTLKTIYVSWGDILNPIDQNHKIQLLSNLDTYKVWDKAKISINSPVKWVKALLTIEKLNSVLAYKVIDIDSYSKEIEIDIKKEYLPNFNIWVYIIKDVENNKDNLIKLKDLRVKMQELESKLQKESKNDFISYRVYDLSIIPNPKDEDFDTNLLWQLANFRLEERELLNKILPEYYIWDLNLKVDLDVIKLNTSIKFDKNSYLPWDKQVIEIEVLDNNKKPISWEISFSIIDESLIALKDNKTDIVNSFYETKPNSVQTFWNLSNLLKRIEFALKQEDVNSGEVFKNNWFGWLWNNITSESAPEMDSMMWDDSWSSSWWWQVKQNLNSTNLRTEFKDIAFYKSKILVKDWKATIIVPKLPDNLTSWIILWYAYSKDQNVWNFENSFKVEKKLSLLPQIPRFFLSWDKWEIWALVVNNSSTKKEINVSLDMTNITKTWVLEKKVILESWKSSLVSFIVDIDSQSFDKTVFTKINLKASSIEDIDSFEVSKPIYPSKTSEYIFTNGMTKDLSYEEKLDFENVLKLNWEIEISLWASILTNLTKNLDKVLTFPNDDLSSKINFLKNALSLEKLYKKLWQVNDFENITLQDYNLKSYKVNEVIEMVKIDIKNYIQNDNWLSYFKNCSTFMFSESCSSIDITKAFLDLNIEVNGVNNKKLLEYYKKALLEKIKENISYNNNYINLSYFTPIALYRDITFINNNLKLDDNLSNLEKLEYLNIYKLLWISWEKNEIYLKDLKNSILIEARWSLLPSQKAFVAWDNSTSTAKMIQVLINQKQDEKLLLQNMVRYLIGNRDETWNYYTYNFSQVIDSITDYVDYTKELENVWFEAKAYLNSKEIMSSKFDDKNKLLPDLQKFPFDKYLNTWSNSLWFEKTWNWLLYYDVWVRYYLPVSTMSSRDEWIIVERNYYKYTDYKDAYKKECFNPWWGWYRFWLNCVNTKVKNIDDIKFAKKWDFIVWEIKITLDKDRKDLVVNSYLPAWIEILNTNFNTTSNEVKDISWENSKSYFYNWFDFIEQKNDRVYLYSKYLQAWTYTYTFVWKASYIWVYNDKPTIAETLNTPEIWWRSKWWTFEIK